MRAVIDSKNFNRAIAATKGFIDPNEFRPHRNYIRLEFNAAGHRMTAMASDGKRLSVEHAMCECDEDFVAYVRPNVNLPNGQTAVIEVTERDTLIRCGGYLFGFQIPKGEDSFDWKKALPPAEPAFRIGFQTKYLLSALQAVKASFEGRLPTTMILEFHGSEKPVILRTNGEDIKLVMPVRIKT